MAKSTKKSTKRENNAGGDDGESSPSKKFKPSRRVPLCWQWEGDKGIWTACAAELTKAINDSLDGDGQNVKFEAAGKTLEVKLDRMVQRNCTTGWERRMRCCIQDGNQYFVWQWKDEKRRWNAYSPSESIALENGRQNSDDTVSLIIAGRSYTINLNDMEQCNDDTDVVREIQRLKTEHNPPSSSIKLVKESTNGVEKETKSGRKVKNEPKVVEEEEQMEEEQEEQPSTSKAKPKTKSGRWNEGVKTVRITGNRPPVDGECVQMSDKAQVYMDATSAMYDAMLNQTNLKNNNNKYYVIQLLEETSRKWYHVWFRWGRVGHKGQNNLVNCGTDLEKAKSTFEQKFWDKTKNEWMNKDSFVKVAGKYDLLKMDYDIKDNETESSGDAKKAKPKVPSKLDIRVQNLVSLICNVKAMEDMVIEMKYDTQKAPLGKLTVDQIKAGYLALKQIEICIEGGIIGDKLIQACDAFYTRIPHNFGMQRPPVIRTKNELKAKLALIEALSDIQVALTVLKSEKNEDEHPIDQQYHSLKCQMKPIDKTSEIFKLIQSYVLNTHAKTHNQYTMTVDEVFDLEKEGEKSRFKDVGNRMLLWHGSRVTNWAGILGQGLRIAPPEAPVTGYMFGKGVYFADMSSKSANYCFATRTNPNGLLTLCEVALGTENELLAADYNADALPPNKQSVKGLGRIAPDPKKSFTMEDGTVIPLGKGIDTKVVNPNGYTLNYNEYVVYNTNQIRMRYLVKLKFNFK
ncbi:poly [ADP-ribose] polymerase 2-like [Lytechinus pictus]|uniref:poly [ADP-ribose] polymerase 2-like n=1 Tax=Lytechinus pictus TaxID=7653 RepID=UPI0030B9C2B2